MSPTNSRKRTPMSDDHKAALAQGREEGRAVRRYLEAIEQQRPRRGRKRTTDSVKRRLAVVEERLSTADALTRLHLLQERTDLQDELSQSGSTEDTGALEAEFIKVAQSYGARKNVSYGAWRAAGVSAAILQQAGISRAAAR